MGDEVRLWRIDDDQFSEISRSPLNFPGRAGLDGDMRPSCTFARRSVMRNVAAVPEGGKANEEIVRVLADVLALPPRQIAIVSGRSARTKIVDVDGLTLAAVNAALARVCDAAR